MLARTSTNNSIHATQSIAPAANPSPMGWTSTNESTNKNAAIAISGCPKKVAQ
jgi:hypothetical protein